MEIMMEDETDYYVDQVCESLSYEVSCRVQHPHFADKHAHEMAKILFRRLSSEKASRLERLSFYRCPNLGVRGIKSILQALSTLSSLQKVQKRKRNSLQLEISSVVIQDKGLTEICEFLFPIRTAHEWMVECSPLLRSLELEDIGRVQNQSTWNSCLPRVLNDKFRLETLDLTHNYLNSETLAVLARSIETNDCLKNLILSENPLIGNGGVKVLSKALEMNSSLNVLSLALCNIQNGGILNLAECLQYHNTQLKKIYLFGNPYNHNSRDKKQLSFWLDMNSHGRGIIRSGIYNSITYHEEGIIPHMLTKAARKSRSDILYGLLREGPHLWIDRLK
jgi:hypothetical protein